MRLLFFSAILAASIVVSVSCATHHVLSKNYPEIVFSDIETDYALTDLNNYGCEKIDFPVLEHILENGTFITEKKLHDNYSTTGCTILGYVKINGKSKHFVYDYGGIIRFDDGKIFACGENCCQEDYPNCSWDKRDLKGY